MYFESGAHFPNAIQNCEFIFYIINSKTNTYKENNHIVLWVKVNSCVGDDVILKISLQ